MATPAPDETIKYGGTDSMFMELTEVRMMGRKSRRCNKFQRVALTGKTNEPWFA
jgi:hypothetical protein